MYSKFGITGSWKDNDRAVTEIPQGKEHQFSNVHAFHQTANEQLNTEAFEEIQIHLDAIQCIRETLQKGLYEFGRRQPKHIT